MDVSRSYLLHSQTFSALDLVALFLEKHIKSNTPSIEDCKFLTVKEVGPFLSFEGNEQL